MHSKHLAVGAAVYAVLFFAAPAGAAQTAAQRGYSEPAGSVQQQLGQNDPSVNTGSVNTGAADNDAGVLPFTGLDLGLVGVAGGLLLAIGLAVRRLVSLQTP
jgi:hypothetical protein